MLRHGPALRDQPRALRESRGLLLPPRRQDDLHRPLHQPRPRLRPLHRRQLRHALPRLRPLQHPRHRALGQRPHPRRLLLLAQHRDRRQVRRQRRLPARHPDRRRRRHRSSSTATSGSPRTGVAAVRWMEAHAATRWLVALGRRYRPQFEFLWDRVTPGGTFGLEFTSLMAVLAVSLFVLVAYGVDGRRATRGRPPATSPRSNVAERLRAGWLTDFAKVCHLPRLRRLHLGPDRGLRGAARRPPPLGRGRGAAGGDDADLDRHPRDQGRGRPAAARRRRWSTPPGSSFPSGHAAHSVLYVWLAVTIVLRLRPGMARGAAVVAAGFALTILVGLSRVYLNVHYLSDVSGGWALGAACFSLLRRRRPRHHPGAAESTPVTLFALAENRPPVPPLRRRRADLPGRLRRP